MRIRVLILALTLGVLAPAVPVAEAGQPVILRDGVIVSGSMIRLGDLFTGAGESADIHVAYAPAPGKRAVLDARWLYRVARTHGLAWRPSSNRDKVVVERESVVIGREEIETQIHGALLERGLDPDTQVELSNRLFRIHIPADISSELTVEDVAYNARSRHFTAILAVGGGMASTQQYRVTGKAHRVSQVPVLARRVSRGEVIREADLEWVAMRTDHLPRNSILDAGKLLGMAAKRPLRAQRPLATTDVRAPVLVPKRSLVTIVCRQPRMTLTSRGQAMEDGSEGDVIRVANTQSHTVIEAVVVGPHMVAVVPLGQLTAR